VVTRPREQRAPGLPNAFPESIFLIKPHSSVSDDATNDFDAIVQSLVDEREEARAEGDYDRADAIREKLDDLGIVVMDDDGDTTWRREEA